ncbi:MAG TPA: spore coat protein U domain-containing protein [Burkholderiaceae bacterium]|nr:spore coat protein U domain-containing protein [Burkholderiaceae bacterium]HQR71107.1 spore coat protein U domain-containing protein [Burkholderiaceae bacterium]
MNRRILCVFAFGLGMLPLVSSAQTVSLSATVANQCSVGNATVNLGALNLAVQTNNTANSVSLTCNRGATVTVALNNGLNPTGTQKRLRQGATTDYLNYNISRPTISGTTTSCPALPGTEWNGTNTLVATSMFSATGGARSLSLCVSVPAGQFNVGAGTFTDTVTATLTVV